LAQSIGYGRFDQHAQKAVSRFAISDEELNQRAFDAERNARHKLGAASTPPATQPAQSEIDSELDNLQVGICALASVIEELHKRLVPVTMPTPPADACASEPGRPVRGSQVGSRVQDAVVRLHNLQASLRGLINLLAV